MAINYRAELKALREKIGVGITNGIRILNEVDGDVDAAVERVVQEYIGLIRARADVSAERALELLKRCKYEPKRVLDILQEELDELTYSKTELILKRSGSDWFDAIQRIAEMLERIYGLKRDESGQVLLASDPVGLNDDQLCVVVVCQWLSYEEDEGMDFAISFWSELVQEQLLKKLKMERFAEALRVGHSLKTAASNAFSSIKDPSKRFMAIYRHLEEDLIYRAALSYLNESRQALIDRLYAFIKDNIASFP
jgi:hypothetical protein